MLHMVSYQKVNLVKLLYPLSQKDFNNKDKLQNAVFYELPHDAVGVENKKMTNHINSDTEIQEKIKENETP